MTQEKIEKFKTDYQQLYGDELAIALQNTPNGDSLKVEAFVNRVERLILTLIKKTSPTFNENELSEYQEEQIWNSLLEQAYYTINVGDFTIFSGVDFANNSIMDNQALRKRIYSSIAIDILTASGLLYVGIRRGGTFGY